MTRVPVRYLADRADKPKMTFSRSRGKGIQNHTALVVLTQVISNRSFHPMFASGPKQPTAYLLQAQRLSEGIFRAVAEFLECHIFWCVRFPFRYVSSGSPAEKAAVEMARAARQAAWTEKVRRAIHDEDGTAVCTFCQYPVPFFRKAIVVGFKGGDDPCVSTFFDGVKIKGIVVGWMGGVDPWPSI